MIKSIKDVDLLGKRILMRVDFNMEFNQDGKILDTFRIDSLEATFDYILGQGGRLILISHLGDPQEVKEEFSLKKLGYYFKDHFKKYNFKFLGDVEDHNILVAIDKLRDGEIGFLENLRFHPEEKLNDDNFSKKLASLGDLYVNEAFSVSHRPHASIVGITKYLPSYAGLLFDQEVKTLKESLLYQRRPLAVILGGSKISSKFHFIKYFLGVADQVILGGGLANAFLRARGLNIGDSVINGHDLEIDQSLLYNPRLYLPVDVLVVKNDQSDEVSCRLIEQVENGDIIYDIGPKTVELFSEIIEESGQIIWNGPMGLLEDSRFTQGTLGVAQAIAESLPYSIIGGGETAMALHKFGLSDKINYISTGGGATLEFLSGQELPGIKALENN